MNLLRYGKALLVCAGAIVLMFGIVSLVDFGLAALYPPFYSRTALIVTFGIGGLFAAVFGYIYGIREAPPKKGTACWVLIIFLGLTGLLFFLVLAKLEGGEYEAAFKGFGATLALASFLFVKGEVE